MDAAAFLAQMDVFGGMRLFFERVADRPWITLVELLLIGSVVYSTLRALQGTRGARLVRAVLTILAVQMRGPYQVRLPIEDRPAMPEFRWTAIR